MPADCETCGRVDLPAAGENAWWLACEFPGLASCEKVDVGQALILAPMYEIEEPIDLLVRQLAAICKGLAKAKAENVRKQQGRGRHSS